MSIKAVLWDFSGVLFIPIEGRGHDYYAQSLGLSSETLTKYYKDDLNRKLNLGEIDHKTFYRTMFKEQGINEELLSLYEEVFYQSFQLNIPLVDRIKSIRKTKKVGLLSNYSNRLRPMLENNLKIAGLFDELIISCEVRMVKPDEAIYRLALARLDVQPQETIFVDDLIENIEAAQKIGIHAIHFQNTAQVISEVGQMLG